MCATGVTSTRGVMFDAGAGQLIPLARPVVVNAASAAMAVSLVMSFIYVGLFVLLFFAGLKSPALTHTPPTEKSLTIF